MTHERAPKGRRRAVFLDRDGVLNLDHGYVHAPHQVDWTPGAKARPHHAQGHARPRGAGPATHPVAQGKLSHDRSRASRPDRRQPAKAGASYLRVSSARQVEHDVSIPDQKRQGEDYCAARGNELVETPGVRSSVLKWRRWRPPFSGLWRFHGVRRQIMNQLKFRDISRRKFLVVS